MIGVDRNHVSEKILGIVRTRRDAGQHGIGPARENMREAFDFVLTVTRYRRAVGIEFLRAVLVELPDTDGKQLHELTRVVFIRVHARLGLVIVDHVQIVAHYRR